MAMLAGPEHVLEMANPAYMQRVGNRDVIGKSAREAFPEVEGQGFPDLLGEVDQTGEAFVGWGHASCDASASRRRGQVVTITPITQRRDRRH